MCRASVDDLFDKAAYHALRVLEAVPTADLQDQLGGGRQGRVLGDLGAMRDDALAAFGPGIAGGLVAPRGIDETGAIAGAGAAAGIDED